ncbi:MAG: hypothetical protein K0S27_911 [Gammaproteobacteria bacterium]|jgi:uncharacterized protein|nr:hypothetical protein [Gammaproteobacteria bacterium]
MSLTLDENSAFYQIHAYQPGQLQVNDQIFLRSIIITPHTLIDTWAPQTIHELTREDLAAVIELRPTILLIGTGHALYFPPLKVYGDLINYGIGVEIMNTHAACRTYNVLTAEGRSIAAAMIIK